MAPRTVLFITGNKNKLAEVAAYIGDEVDLQSKAVDLDEIQGSISQITMDKCSRAAKAVNGPVLVEDTCLSFNAMGELPGPYIKHFLQQLGPEGLNTLLSGFEDKSAQAVCTFGFSEGPGTEPILFQGRCQGKIVPPRGPTTFGWDCIFEYQGETFAEMSKAAKNEISHRGKALAKLRAWLAEN